VITDDTGIFVVTYYQFDKKTNIIIKNGVTYYITRGNQGFLLNFVVGRFM